jgi:DNA-binding winged helix-turn-helix (wHTH) protein/tetratricopeptide (TPR) repeat protein
METREIYRFGRFRMDVDERFLELADASQKLALTEKAFQILTLLIRRKGHLVTKQVLLDEIWPDSNVEENNLEKHIHAIRRVLGHDPGDVTYIETVRKHGYRFLADIQRVDGNDAEESIPGELPSPTNDLAGEQPKETSRLTPLAISIGVLVCIAIASYSYLSRQSVSATGKTSIAVLPVRPISASNRDDIYELGVADSVINRLSTIGGVIVRPLSATRQYTDVSQDPVAVGREQLVDYVVASNYQLADGKIKVTSQLINVHGGQIEDTFRTEAAAEDIFAMQDAIANEMGTRFLAIFATTSSGLAVNRGTLNVDAYRLYLQAKNLSARRNLKDSQKGIEYFKQAIRLDPNYARAYAGVAHAYIASGNLGGGVPRDEYEKAREAVAKSLELDPNLAEGYRILGELKHVYEWDSAAAEKAWQRAAELEPNAESRYGGYLGDTGRIDESLAALDNMLVFDPNSLSLMRERGRILYLGRRYDEAIVQFKRVLELDENYGTANGILIQALDLNGDSAGAYEWYLKERIKIDPENIPLYQKAYEIDGWRGVCRQDMERELANEHKPSGSNYYRLARLSAMNGETETVFNYLNKAIERRQGQLRMLKMAPEFDLVRADPRFSDALRRVGY